MKSRFFFAMVIGLVFSTAYGQDAPAGTVTAPPPVQNPTQGPGPGGFQGQRGGRGGMMGGPGMAGHGVVGTVVEATPEHFILKTESGEIYTAHISVNTRIVKQRVTRSGAPGEEGSGGPPQTLKAIDIRVGDAIAAIGEVDTAAKSVGAMTIVQIDPERARQMREMQANYGKTWLMGKVTAVDGVKVTLQGGLDNAVRTFVADENTTFRKRREPITLADVQVGDAVRVEGAVKDGTFVATTVAVMGPRNVTMPRQPNAPNGGASPQPQ
jgi:hypothetical protein